jgi:hypothetical protein
MRETKIEYRFAMWKYLGKQPLGRPRKRRENNIKMYLI